MRSWLRVYRVHCWQKIRRSLLDRDPFFIFLFFCWCIARLCVRIEDDCNQRKMNWLDIFRDARKDPAEQHDGGIVNFVLLAIRRENLSPEKKERILNFFFSYRIFCVHVIFVRLHFWLPLQGSKFVVSFLFFWCSSFYSFAIGINFFRSTEKKISRKINRDGSFWAAPVSWIGLPVTNDYRYHHDLSLLLFPQNL